MKSLRYFHNPGLKRSTSFRQRYKAALVAALIDYRKPLPLERADASAYRCPILPEHSRDFALLHHIVRKQQAHYQIFRRRDVKTGIFESLGQSCLLCLIGNPEKAAHIGNRVYILFISHIITITHKLEYCCCDNNNPEIISLPRT